MDALQTFLYCYYMNRDQAQTFIQTACDKAWLRLRTMYGAKVGKQPTIVLNNRLRSTAGRAFLHDSKIDISYKLLIEFPAHFAKDTIPHECAHFVASRVFGEDNHGKPWKQVMAALGLPTTPYHNLVMQQRIKQTANAEGLQLPKYVTLTDGRKIELMPMLVKLVEGTE